MSKICTDLEQSRKLVELGIEPNTADMLWGYYYNGENHCVPNIRPFRDARNEIPNGYSPAWSLSALLELMPMTCDVIKDFHNLYYCSNKFNDNSLDNWHLTTTCKTSIDAAYEMVVWLLEKGYIKPIK